jgi:hypothetical protein
VSSDEDRSSCDRWRRERQQDEGDDPIEHETNAQPGTHE